MIPVSVRFRALAVVAILGFALAGCTPRASQGPNADRPDAGGRGGPSTERSAESTGARRGSTGEVTTFDNGLECPGGMAVSGIGDYAPAPGTEGREADPVKLARRDFSEQIGEGDRVGLSTTPQRGDQRTVRVVREGRTVALIVYRRAGGGWLRDSYDACAGFAGF